MATKIGNRAPSFKMPADDGSTLESKNLKGRNVVLYFYPKDDTPGCTKEAIAFRDHIKNFEKLNTIIVGVSKDSVKKHEKFKAKYDLNFSLGSDEEADVCEKFGVWKEKSMYGRTYMGIERSTFLIDSTGTLRAEWRKVKVPGHVEEVIAAVMDL